MSDNSSILPSRNGKFATPISSLFTSPKVFVGFSAKGLSDSGAAMSSTSILEIKPFSAIGNPSFADRNIRKPHWDNGDSRAIGLGIVDALNNEKFDKRSMNPNNRMILFGSQLKIQISPARSNSISPTGSVESPRTPIEFGIKNKNSQLALRSPAGLRIEIEPSPPRILPGCLSPEDMELSEDYTCVISHGPNPKKTHIFDNCIVESSCESGKENNFSAELISVYPSEDFLSFCYTCKKVLAQGEDIFIYRGEKAFCSRECRQQEMVFDDEETEKCCEDIFDPF
ncbi:hypothetical protein AXF42_Ash014319 [Apostasia shenzhenica]|uniref:FLZ-type domain-containing protein n=1 Tax=Apostasia shenzhenica TaxID=1088818 RepID=A0A2I0B0S7_9ASPA|nr:hypothetical protein AXF42_Ash014319 [Apostasia shenzhenica]